MKRVLFTALLCACFCHSVASHADDFSMDDSSSEDSVANEKNTNGFFPAGSTRWFDDRSAETVFAKEPVKSDSPEVGFYQEHEEKVEEAPEELFQHPQMMQAGEQPAKPPFDPKKASQKELISFFGNPDEEAPFAPEDKSPKPFKAMMAAMDSGNEKLAYKYARQYVRYVQGVQNRVKTADDLTEIAIEREGIRKGNLTNNPYRHLLNEDLEAEEASPAEVGRALGKVDPKTANILRKAQEDEAHAAKNYQGPSNVVPVDPKGEVDILFFFKAGEEASMKMAQSVQALRNHLRRDSKVNITGFVLNNVSPDSRAQFIKATGADFEIRNGQAAVGALGIRISPTVVLIARNAGESFKIEERKTAKELLSVVMQMKGERDAQ